MRPRACWTFCVALSASRGRRRRRRVEVEGGLVGGGAAADDRLERDEHAVERLVLGKGRRAAARRWARGRRGERLRLERVGVGGGGERAAAHRRAHVEEDGRRGEADGGGGGSIAGARA